jgi:hypothetical protein
MRGWVGGWIAHTPDLYILYILHDLHIQHLERVGGMVCTYNVLYIQEDFHILFEWVGGRICTYSCRVHTAGLYIQTALHTLDSWRGWVGWIAHTVVLYILATRT